MRCRAVSATVLIGGLCSGSGVRCCSFDPKLCADSVACVRGPVFVLILYLRSSSLWLVFGVRFCFFAAPAPEFVSQRVPQSVPNRPKWTQNGPRAPKNAHKSFQMEPKWPSRCSKIDFSRCWGLLDMKVSSFLGPEWDQSRFQKRCKNMHVFCTGLGSIFFHFGSKMLPKWTPVAAQNDEQTVSSRKSENSF